MLPDTLQPLDDVELARLERFLHTVACGQDAMSLSYAHGFLTAVACGPERLEPAEWLRLMFDEPVFENGAEAGEMLGLALRLFGDIEHGLRGAGLRPRFDTVRGGTHADAQRWCLGFAAGFALFRERWTHDARTALRTPLDLILRLADQRALPDPVYAQLCDVLPDAAGAIYRYWRDAGHH